MKLRRFLRKIGSYFGNERGSWIAVAIGGSALVGGGAAIYSANKAASSNKGVDFYQAPDYPEATGAREEWWSKLQDWSKQPGYGAISPDWEDTWNLAKQKLSQYYWGGTMDTGLAGKVKASAARRGVSQSPALENMLGAMGMQEAQDVSGLASTEAINKVQSEETGRLNWLQSLMGLPGIKPSYYTPSSSGYSGIDLISDLGGGLGGLFAQYSQQEYLGKQKKSEQDWMTSLFKNYSGGSGGNVSLSSNYGSASPQIGYGGISTLNTSQYPNLFGG